MGQSNLQAINYTTLNNNSMGTATKSLWIGNRGGTPIFGIYTGSDPAILDDPTNHLDKIFFHSSFEYLRIKATVDFTITFPARSTRASGGGKKGSSGLVSYNGFADEWVLQLPSSVRPGSVTTPPAMFAVFVKNEVGNGTLAGSGMGGTVPIQVVNNDSFRLATVYNDGEHLVIRERYQIYSQNLPQTSITCRAYFFGSTQGVLAYSGLYAIHSPASFNDNTAYTGAMYRKIYTPITFSSSNSGEYFNKVEVQRVAGAKPTSAIPGVSPARASNYHYVDQINGTGITPTDSYNVWTTAYSGPMTQSFSMRVYTEHPYTGATKSAYYSPRWLVRFTNTSTGETFTDSVGGIHWFRKNGG